MLSLLRRTMSTAPTFKPFNLALIQLGGVTADKSANLKHAREMIMKAAGGEGAPDGAKPQLVVLPVRSFHMLAPAHS
jgi:omega-amidase